MRNTIKKHDDFLVGPDDFNARCAMFFVRARPARFGDDARYGLIVTKKTFKLAVPSVCCVIGFGSMKTRCVMNWTMYLLRADRCCFLGVQMGVRP